MSLLLLCVPDWPFCLTLLVLRVDEHDLGASLLRVRGSSLSPVSIIIEGFKAISDYQPCICCCPACAITDQCCRVSSSVFAAWFLLVNFEGCCISSGSTGKLDYNSVAVLLLFHEVWSCCFCEKLPEVNSLTDIKVIKHSCCSGSIKQGLVLYFQCSLFWWSIEVCLPRCSECLIFGFNDVPEGGCRHYEYVIVIVLKF